MYPKLQVSTPPYVSAKGKDPKESFSGKEEPMSRKIPCPFVDVLIPDPAEKAQNMRCHRARRCRLLISTHTWLFGPS